MPSKIKSCIGFRLAYLHLTNSIAKKEPKTESRWILSYVSVHAVISYFYLLTNLVEWSIGYTYNGCSPLIDTHSFRIRSGTPGCPSGIWWGSCRTPGSRSTAGCTVSSRPATGGWAGSERWLCEIVRLWGCVWKRPASTYGRTACGAASRCAGAASWTPDARRARSGAGRASSKIPENMRRSVLFQQKETDAEEEGVGNRTIYAQALFETTNLLRFCVIEMVSKISRTLPRI